jgi:hypothetical protein
MKRIILLGFIAVTSFISLQFVTVNENKPLENPYDKVGEMHNEAVKYVLQNLEEAPASDEVYQTVINTLKGKYSEEYFENIPNLPNNNIYEHLRNEMKSKFSAEFFAEIESMETFMKTTPNVTQVWENVATKVNSANGTISDETERMYYYHFLSVIKYSSKLWMTTEQGGENGLSLIKFSSDNGKSGDSLLRVPGWKIFLADAAGCVAGAAGSVAATGGASAIPNPALGGLPTASLVGVIAGAGASINKAI